MADEKRSWKRFRKISFDAKSFSKRAKSAETTSTRHARKFVLSKLDSLRNVKQHITVWLAIVGVLIAGVAVQMYWNQMSYKTSAWKDGGAYAEAVLGEINTLNPLYVSTPAEQSAGELLFSALMTYDDTGTLSDDIATSMETSENGREYTVTIRDDIRWSDGARLTAKDIVFTVNLMKSPEARAVMYTNWLDVSAESIDENTVKFTLPAQYASFPHALTFSILPEHILRDVAPGSLRQNAFSVLPVGSGPFTAKLLQNSPDGTHKILNLSASEGYYKGAPRLSRFELHGYKDQESIIRALQTGEVNAAAGTAVKESELPESFTVNEYPVNSGVYALLNTESAVLKNEKIRQALQIGTNTKDLRDAVGYDVPALHLPFTNSQLNGDGVPAPPTYDAAKAKQLLEEAGWKQSPGDKGRVNGEGVALELNVITLRDSTYEKVLERLAGQWRELGIKINTSIKDPSNPAEDYVQSTLQPRAFDVLVSELEIGADPDVFAYWHSSQASLLGRNFTNYRNGVSDETLASARVPSDSALRNEKYKSFARQWLQDAPAIGIYQPVMQYIHRPSVQPALPKDGMPTDADRYSNVLYWSAVQETVYKTP